MACFIVPGTEAIVTTIVTKVIEKKEMKEAESLKRLNGLLWGGSALLAFEHLWHGEIQLFFPFLTAAKDPGQLAEVFHEMSTVGVGMAALVTVVWAVSTKVISVMKKPVTTGKVTQK